MAFNPFPPATLEEVGHRIAALERQNAALWAMLADWYAFRDEKNFAEYIVRNLNETGAPIDEVAADRLRDMIARGPTSRGDPIQDV